MAKTDVGDLIVQWVRAASVRRENRVFNISITLESEFVTPTLSLCDDKSMRRMLTLEEAKKARAALLGVACKLESITEHTESATSAPPFNWVTLLIEALRRFRCDLRQIVLATEQLYGRRLISQPRTDSVSIGDEQLSLIRSILASSAHRSFLSPVPRQYMKGFHPSDEKAVLPLAPQLLVDSAGPDCTELETEMLRLISNRAFCSQLADALGQSATLRATAQDMRFVGRVRAFPYHPLFDFFSTRSAHCALKLPNLLAYVDSSLLVRDVLITPVDGHVANGLHISEVLTRLLNSTLGDPRDYDQVITGLLNSGVVQQSEIGLLSIEVGQ